jgi:hypothetical protein
MGSADAIKALEDSFVKEAYLKMDDDGKSGMIYCRKRCSTGKFDSKKMARDLLEYLRDEGFVSQKEFEKVRTEIENSALPESLDRDSTN